jgi:putative solute:sodium symporter small subunit
MSSVTWAGNLHDSVYTAGQTTDRDKMVSKENKDKYWKANLRVVFICLLVWFVVSYGFGILLVDVLNQYSFFGFKLGFWFAQQGSIYVFLILVFYYARKMNQLDRKFGVDEDGS